MQEQADVGHEGLALLGVGIAQCAVQDELELRENRIAGPEVHGGDASSGEF